MRKLDLFRFMPNFKPYTLGARSGLTNQFGDTVCLRQLWTASIVTNPASAERVLQANSRKYPKSKN